MTTVYNEFNRIKTEVFRTNKQYECFAINDAKSRVMAATHKMLEEANPQPGDKIIFDVRLMVEREEGIVKMVLEAEK